jgi:hypothetical protein
MTTPRDDWRLGARVGPRLHRLAAHSAVAVYESVCTPIDGYVRPTRHQSMERSAYVTLMLQLGSLRRK